jgi:hypothetical protein
VRCADRFPEPLNPGASNGPALRHAVTLLLALLASGCSAPPDGAASSATTSGPGAAASSRGSAAGGVAAKAPPRRAAKPSTDWDDYRQRAAERIVVMNPEGTYSGPVPEPLLAIPVLAIELNADGSVHRIRVLRPPGQALDTVQLAMAAVRRAAPFAPVSHLPRPWTFTETFLFNEQRRFKPRSLDV